MKNTYITTPVLTPDGPDLQTVRAIGTPEILPSGCRFNAQNGRITILNMPITIVESDEDLMGQHLDKTQTAEQPEPAAPAAAAD